MGHIEGMAEARRALDQLNDHVQKLVAKTALREGQAVIAAEVERRAPVSSRPGNPTPGSLRRSIRKMPVRLTKRGAITSIRVDDVAAVPNEYGTSKMTAQPFFRPGVDAKREEAGRAIAEEI